MTVVEVLPYVNLLIVPAIAMLHRIGLDIATLKADRANDRQRIEQLEKAIA